MTTYIKSPCQVRGLTDIYLNAFGYITDGYFVEIGAFNCYNWSNTYRLAVAGWRGLMIEPQEQYVRDCQKLYKDNPRIIIEQCCVGKYNGKIKLYLGGSLTTTKAHMVDVYGDIKWGKSSRLAHDRFTIVDIFTLDRLLLNHNVPIGFQVLSVDVEGAEMDVLAPFDIEYWKPKVVIVETHEQYPDERLSSKSIPINAYFDLFGYNKVYSDHINCVYVRN